MRSRWFTLHRWVLMSYLFFMMAITVYPQGSRGITLSGKVSLPDGNPAAQLPVTVSGTNGFSARTNTDDVGNFRFEGIPRSVYSVTVTLPKDSQFRAEPLLADTSREGLNFVVSIFLRDPLGASVGKKESTQLVSTKVASQQIPKDARKALDKARKLREHKKFDAALAELEKAIGLFPDYFQAYTEKGTVQIQSSHEQKAFQDFSKAIQIFPEYEPALSGAGYCLLTLGKYEQSIDLLEKAIHLDATHVQNLLFLGIANLALSRWEKAQEALEQALRLNPAGMNSAHLYLANALAGQKLFSRAADELHTYLELNPGAPNADRLKNKEHYWRTQVAQGLMIDKGSDP